MKKTILIGAVVALLCGAMAATNPSADPTKEILTLERQAMDGWLKGNPDAALAMFDPDITYFHVMTDARVNGLPAVKAIFEPYRGTPLFDSYQISDPKVQVSGDTAILTYILVRQNGSATSRWNATQVYQHKDQGWRVIHSHWSQTKPPIPAP